MVTLPVSGGPSWPDEEFLVAVPVVRFPVDHNRRLLELHPNHHP